MNKNVKEKSFYFFEEQKLIVFIFVWSVLILVFFGFSEI